MVFSTFLSFQGLPKPDRGLNRKRDRRDKTSYKGDTRLKREPALGFDHAAVQGN